MEANFMATDQNFQFLLNCFASAIRDNKNYCSVLFNATRIISRTKTWYISQFALQFQTAAIQSSMSVPSTFDYGWLAKTLNNSIESVWKQIAAVSRVSSFFQSCCLSIICSVYILHILKVKYFLKMCEYSTALIIFRRFVHMNGHKFWPTNQNACHNHTSTRLRAQSSSGISYPFKQSILCMKNIHYQCKSTKKRKTIFVTFFWWRPGQGVMGVQHFRVSKSSQVHPKDAQMPPG